MPTPPPEVGDHKRLVRLPHTLEYDRRYAQHDQADDSDVEDTSRGCI